MKNVIPAPLLLALCCSAAFAPAEALERSHDGTGQAILLPYYTVDDGRSTLFAITNHADQPKAVRVLIAEGRNGRAALGFNVYLRARDTWTAAIVQVGEKARLVASDPSCTVPAVAAQGQDLLDFAFTGSSDDGLGSDPQRLHRGSIEVIEQGVLTGLAATFVDQNQCASLRSRFGSGGVWITDPNLEVQAPSGRVSAEAQVIDVAAGVAFNTAPFAIDNFSGAARHGSPGDDYASVRLTKPTLAANQTRFVVDGQSYIAADRPADATSLMLMAAELEGSFLLNPSLDARTEWIVTLPTRQAYVDDSAGGALPAGTGPLDPFTSGDFPREDCVSATWQVIKRDGSLQPEFPTSLCEQVSKIDFLLGTPGSSNPPEQVSQFYTMGIESGRVRLGLRPDLHQMNYSTGPNGAFGARLFGLPVVAQALMEVRNANAQPGLLASYAISGAVVRKQDGFIEF